MSRNTRLAALALSLLGATMAGLWACQPAVVVPPLDPLPVSLVLSPMLTAIPADGTATTLFISVAEADGTLGTGSVTLAAKQGSLGAEGIVQTSVDLVNGRAIIRYWCDGAKNDKCTGTQRIDGVWGDATANTSITLWPRAATDGGTVGPGPGSDAGTVLPPVVYDPASVYLFGTLQEAVGGLDAVCTFADPTKADIGFPGGPRRVTLGVAGEVLYEDDGTGKIYRHAPDSFVPDGTFAGCWDYPSPASVVEANDSDLTPAGCTAFNGFLVAPDSGDVFARCIVAPSTLGWVSTKGAAAWLDSAGNSVIAMGRNNIALAPNGVLSPSGLARYSSSLLASIRFGRANGDGFLVLAYNGIGATSYERWSVASDGTATKEGVFAAPPTGITAEPSVLDGSGTAYGVGWRSTEDVVVRFPLAPAAAEIVYDEADTHPVDMCSTPPKVWVKMHASVLFTGP
jgi:hypothetical protein